MSSKPKDYIRLVDQSTHNLEHAKLCLKWEHHGWGCFSAQKAAELAVKAVLSLKDLEWMKKVERSRRHNITALLRMLQEHVMTPQEIWQAAEELEHLNYRTLRGQSGSCPLLAQVLFGDNPSLEGYAPYEVVTKDECQNKFNAAELICIWARRLIFDVKRPRKSTL